MGRQFAEIDFDRLMELNKINLPRPVIADELGISVPTLNKRIAEIKDKQGILLRYRELQSLQLTSIQARILEHITPEKIAEAPLRDLILAFKILKDKELVVDGKPSEIKGLVGYLIELEKKESLIDQGQYTDAEFEEAAEAATLSGPASLPVDVSSPDYKPRL